MPRKTTPDLAQIRKIARDKFGFASLHPAQEQAVMALLGGHDTLSVMPTGSGKSAIYQIAGLLLNGPTVVISPLIALQKDQLDSIDDKSIAPAAVVNSTQRISERREALEGLEGGSLEFLFLSPEQLANEETRRQVLQNRPSLFVVDEAHCLSEWGHDFRPDYARLGAAIESLAHPRVLALTATASPAVQQHIIDGLGMRNVRTIVWGFDRPNIWLGVEVCPDESTKDRLIIDRVRDNQKPAIVYVATRGHAEQIALRLREENINAVHYHGAMNKNERHAVQDAFMNDEHDVIVATNAFGMGVDKPNVRTVIHYDVPESVDAYYQEVGRAGRDGKPAKALMLYYSGDLGFRRAQAAGGKLNEEQVQQLVESLRQRRGAAELSDLAEETELSKSKVATAINRLADLGAVEILPDGEVKRVGRINPGDAAEKVVRDQEEYRQYRIARVDLMRDYAQTTECRRQYILNYFGEITDEICNHCDNCNAGLSQQRRREEQRDEHPFRVKARVVHKKYGTGIIMRYDGESVVVAFDEAGPKELNTKFVIDHALLEPA
jgi:ATP-dependent DNA helicase RecQ